MAEIIVPYLGVDPTLPYAIVDPQSRTEHIVFKPAEVVPRPETAQFAKELNDPTIIEVGNTRLGLYHLNRAYEEEGFKPVTINLPLGEVAQTGTGRLGLNAFAQSIGRPVVVVDMLGMGASEDTPLRLVALSSLRKLAETLVAAYDEIGLVEFDAVGISMGSLLATATAEAAGERVSSLQTFAAPSFEARNIWRLHHAHCVRSKPDFRRTRDEAIPEVRQELDAFEETRQIERRAKTWRSRAKTQAVVLKQASIVCGPHMTNLVDRLAPETKWFDVIGSEDAFTYWEDHLDEVRARNKVYPDSSDLTVLDGESHAWLAVRRWDMAKRAGETLEKVKSEAPKTRVTL